MVEIRLDLDYVTRDGDAATGFKDSRFISDWVLRQAIGAKYPKAPKKGPEQRNMRRVLNAFGRAMKANQDAVEISEGELEWLVKDVFAEFEISPSTYVHWACEFSDHLEEVQAQAKAAGGTVKWPPVEKSGTPTQ